MSDNIPQSPKDIEELSICRKHRTNRAQMNCSICGSHRATNWQNLLWRQWIDEADLESVIKDSELGGNLWDTNIKILSTAIKAYLKGEGG
jgi:hypothetical protein